MPKIWTEKGEIINPSSFQDFFCRVPSTREACTRLRQEWQKVEFFPLQLSIAYEGRGDIKKNIGMNLFYPYRLENIGIILKKISMQVGSKWPYHYSKFLVLRKSWQWAGCTILIVHLVSMVGESLRV